MKKIYSMFFLFLIALGTAQDFAYANPNMPQSGQQSTPASNSSDNVPGSAQKAKEAVKKQEESQEIQGLTLKQGCMIIVQWIVFVLMGAAANLSTGKSKDEYRR